MNDARRIIVVDDEAGLRRMVEDYLTVHGFSVRAADGGAALDALLAEAPADLVLLDVNMPGEDGISVAGRLRRKGERAGLLMLTAAGDEAHRVAGLGAGADDYLVKPFDLRELLARIRSVLRRLPARPETAPPPSRHVAMGVCRLDLDGRRLLGRDGAAVTLSAMEYELLEAFARHPRQILSRDRLCQLAHGRALSDAERSVDIRISRLRKKLEPNPAEPRHLRTIRGEGYVFEP